MKLTRELLQEENSRQLKLKLGRIEDLFERIHTMLEPNAQLARALSSNEETKDLVRLDLKNLEKEFARVYDTFMDFQMAVGQATATYDEDDR